MASKPVAMPLKLLDCCPVSDGGAAFVISRERTSGIGVRVRGCAQAHTHQHVTAAPALSELGAEISITGAKQAAGLAISDVRYAAIVGIATSWLTTPPLAWLLGVHAGLGAVGGWLGLAIEIVVGAVLFWHRVQRGGWRPAAAKARRQIHGGCV